MAQPGTVFGGMGVGLKAVRAEVFKVKPSQPLTWPDRHSGDADSEKQALRSAIATVARSLTELSEKETTIGADIFQALKMLLEDVELLKAATQFIDQGWSAATSFMMAVDQFGDLLAGDPVLEQRVLDLRDLASKLAAEIHGTQLRIEIPTSGRFVLVGEDFSPTDTALFTKAVVGVVTTKGGPTSHTAIICRSRSIPAVVACQGAEALVDGEFVLVDPLGDRVVVDGDESMATKPLEFIATSKEPIIPVRANIGSLAESVSASSTAANGVGLFRTELLYLSSTEMPTVDSQAQSYSEILRAAPAGPVVVRTFDAAIDKPVPFLPIDSFTNPDLTPPGYGLLRHRQIILDQLKSLQIAREQTGRELWVMAPMIATPQQAREFAAMARSVGEFRVGVMVEIPSLAGVITELSGDLDFISVGTNDLSKYIFGEDRLNPAARDLLSPWQPNLIHLLAKIAKDARTAKLSAAVCGESASDPVFSVVLAGLGFDSISASIAQVDAVRTALRSVSVDQARLVADAALAGQSAEAAKLNALAALANLQSD